MDERIRVKLWLMVRADHGPMGHAKEASLADVLKQVPRANVKYVGDEVSALPDVNPDGNAAKPGNATELAMEVSRAGGTLRPGFYHLRKVSPSAIARLTRSSTLAMPLPRSAAAEFSTGSSPQEGAERRSA